MARKTLGGGISSVGDTSSDSYAALHRLLHYAAREAAEQNRSTTTKLIQAAIASLAEQAPLGRNPPQPAGDSLPPLGHC